MSAGQLALVPFPFSSLQIGEEYKPRPVLVVSEVTNDDVTILCAMVTSNARRFARPKAGDIPLVDYAAYGLPQPSVVRCRRIWTAETRDILRVIGVVPPDLLEQVRDDIISYVRPAA